MLPPLLAVAEAPACEESDVEEGGLGRSENRLGKKPEHGASLSSLWMAAVCATA